jgi:hypothetical protein
VIEDRLFAPWTLGYHLPPEWQCDALQLWYELCRKVVDSQD